MASDSSSGFRLRALHVYLQIRKTQPRGWRKRTNYQTRTWVSSKCKKGEVYMTRLWSFPCICERVFSAKFHNVIRNADSSLDCSASIFSLSPADCVLLWTAISSRLFYSAFLCHSVFPGTFLCHSVFPGTFLPHFTFSLAGDLTLRPFVWVWRQSKEILVSAPKQTEMNATHRVTNSLYFCLVIMLYNLH